jgi:flagellar FliL protein
MAEEAQEVESAPKAKSPLVKIIALVLAVILLLVAAVVGTLFATGFFNKKEVLDADQQIEHAVEAGGKLPPKDCKDGKDSHGKPCKEAPSKVKKDSPEMTRFEYTYMQIEREFLVNLSNSRKVMNVQLAIMTHYDERVFENVKKHDFAIRSAIMDVMRQTVEADISKPDFRVELAKRIRDAMNTLLEKYEDFGGIEEVYFTNFLVQ